MLCEDDEATRAQRVSTCSPWYRGYLLALGTVPVAALGLEFRSIQQYYAVFGACFMPFLAGALLLLNGLARHLGTEHRNRAATNLALIATLAFFALAVVFEVRKRFGG